MRGEPEMATTSSMRNRVWYFAMRAMAHLPDRLKIWLSGTAPVIVDGQQLDPQLQLLRSIRRRHTVPGLVEPTVAAGRARYRRETSFPRGPGTKVGAVATSRSTARAGRCARDTTRRSTARRPR